MHNVLCLGLGQIGSAIKQIEEEAGNSVDHITRNENTASEGKQYYMMHIAIPFTNDGAEEYFATIKKYHDMYLPQYIINHGTVPVGTTDKLKDVLKKQRIAYSPVNGKHPTLYPSIKTYFTKCISELWGALYLKNIGIDKVEYMPTKELELAKTLITTAYGRDILFAKVVGKMCEEAGLNYDDVYTKMTKFYNDGYQSLGEHQFTRPILTPPAGDGLGGHCIEQNVELIPNTMRIADIFRFLNRGVDL